MYASQVPYRELYDALLDCPGGGVFETLLLPWVARNGQERKWLEELGARGGDPWPPASDEELCRLYALMRVNELLLLRFQPRMGAAAAWHGPAISVAEYGEFATRLGLQMVERGRFHPFFHEIVTVESVADVHAPIELAAVRWPCLMLCDLLFSRAGCDVRGGTEVVIPAVATGSTLYWAHRRMHRPVVDLSVGWGSNSQWRTAARRDYWRGRQFHFNVDGRLDVREADPERGRANPAREKLTADERVELLTHRTLVRTTRPHADVCPWEDRYSVAEEE